MNCAINSSLNASCLSRCRGHESSEYPGYSLLMRVVIAESIHTTPSAKVLLCGARAVHVRHPFPVSAYMRRRLEKLRHLASGRLTCMV